MERQMELFVIYQCPSCYLPTDRRNGSCEGCDPKAVAVETHWEIRDAVFIAGALVIGAIALWWSK